MVQPSREWSEALATSQEVMGSITGSTVGFSLKGELSHGMDWELGLHVFEDHLDRTQHLHFLFFI